MDGIKNPHQSGAKGRAQDRHSPGCRIKQAVDCSTFLFFRNQGKERPVARHIKGAEHLLKKADRQQLPEFQKSEMMRYHQRERQNDSEEFEPDD
jgi:hypothetical protein